MCPSEGSIEEESSVESGSFPDSWETALNNDGKELFERYHDGEGEVMSDDQGLEVFQNIFTSESARMMQESLDRKFLSHVATGDLPLSAGESDEAEQILSRTYHMQGCNLDEGSETYELATELDLFQFTRSDELRQFVEGVTGLALKGPGGHQLLYYEQGDYTAPHTDFSEQPYREDGYVVAHIMLSNPHVERQLLVGEVDDHLSDCYEVGVESGITVSKLPSWHYTTPLEGGEDANRWLINVTYDIVED